MIKDEQTPSKKIFGKYQPLFIAAILLTAVNLRPAITSVGPLIGMIRDSMKFANWNVALLTSLPLVAFMLVSPLAPKLSGRISIERTLALGLLILVLGVGLRSIPVMTYLFIGTALIGCGIAICNVLLPSIIQAKFPHKIGIMTGLYTTFMTFSATIASGVSIPLVNQLGLGWTQSLLVWAIPAILGFIAWLTILIKVPTHTGKVCSNRRSASTKSSVWTDPLAWKVTLFMGFQSLTFYIMLSWLPEILHFYGMSITSAGLMLSYLQFLGIPLSFIVPIIAVRVKQQGLFLVAVNLLFIGGLLLILLHGTPAIMPIAITMIGIAMGSNFALALTFFTIRAKGADNVANLSGMAQSVGYCIAAVGPIFLGFLFDVTQDWKYPLMVILLFVLALMYFGYHAGKNQLVLTDV